MDKRMIAVFRLSMNHSLIETLKDENKKARQAAALALEKIPSDKAVKPLIKALKDEDSEVQMLATFALEKIGTPKALKAVKEYTPEGITWV